MPAERFARLLPRLTVPVGMEAYQAMGFAITVHGETDEHLATAGSEDPCRICLRKVFPGDRAIWVKLRRVGSVKAGRKTALVHEACEAGAPSDPPSSTGGRTR